MSTASQTILSAATAAAAAAAAVPAPAPAPAASSVTGVTLGYFQTPGVPEYVHLYIHLYILQEPPFYMPHVPEHFFSSLQRDPSFWNPPTWCRQIFSPKHLGCPGHLGSFVLCRLCSIMGIYRDYLGTMEKKMETTLCNRREM